MNERVNIPNEVSLSKIISTAYDLSIPIGMGHLHFIAGVIPGATLNSLLHDLNQKFAAYNDDMLKTMKHDPCVLSMDYVHGRAVKMSIFKDRSTGDLYLTPMWRDHTADTYNTFLRRVGIIGEHDEYIRTGRVPTMGGTVS